MLNKEIQKTKYLVSKIEEIEKTIQEIEDRIYEESIENPKNIIIESIFVFLLISISVVLMFVLKKYLVFFLILIVLISVIFLLYFISWYKEKRTKEKLLNSLVTDKFNLETFLDTLPKKNILNEKLKNLIKNTNE
jgi:pilus assembly protein TadC